MHHTLQLTNMKEILLQTSVVSFFIFILVVYASMFLTPFEEETKLFSKDYWRDILAKNIMLIASIMVCVGFIQIMHRVTDYYIDHK